MIVAGIGFRSKAPVDALAEALALAQAAGGPEITALATATAKAQSPQITALAARLNLPLIAVDVAGTDTPTRSGHVITRFATGSLAEAAALRAAGPDATLLGPRVTSSDGMATAAIAIGDNA